MHFTRPFLVTASLVLATNVHAAANDCDRNCLRDITHRYLKAMVKHDPQGAPLAATLRYTENAVDMRPGEGLWKTSTALGKFQRFYGDPVQGQAAYFGLIDEGDVGAIVSLRLKVVKRKITEAEAIVGRKGVSLYEPQNLIDHGPSDQPIAKSLRTSRTEMIAAADSYFNGAQSQNPTIVLQKPGCDRYENGVKMTHRQGPGAGGVSMESDCAATIANAKQIAAVVNRRYPVVDEEAGMVMGTAMFNRPPGSKRADGTLWPRLLLTEFFPVENARFTTIYAAMFYLPAEAVDSGWRADPVDANGTWQLTVLDTGRTFTPSFALKQQGENLTGTYKNSQGDSAANGTIKGNEVTLNAEITGQDGNKRIVTYTGTMSGDTMTGKMQTTRADVTFSAKRETAK